MKYLFLALVILSNVVFADEIVQSVTKIDNTQVEIIYQPKIKRVLLKDINEELQKLRDEKQRLLDMIASYQERVVEQNEKISSLVYLKAQINSLGVEE